MVLTNVQSIVGANLCIGCGVCELACPVNAIRLVFDSLRGHHRPDISKDCNFCGNCLKVCFGNNIGYNENSGNRLESSLGSYKKCYSGYSADPSVRYTASSGGIVSSLLESMLTRKELDGAIVSFIEKEYPFRAFASIVHSKKQVYSSSGSKYSPVVLTEALRKIDSEKIYAFVGLPCHIYAVKELQKLKRIPDSIKVYVSLICGGTLCTNGTTYILRTIGLDRNEIHSIQYRGNGWPGQFTAQTREEDLVRTPFIDYWPATARWFYLNRCMVCISGLGANADISCGDYWLPSVMKSDNQGTSVFIVRTEIGNDIVNIAIKDQKVVCSSIKWKSVLESQRMLFEFKHKKLGSRLFLRNVKHQTHPYNLRNTTNLHVNSKTIFDEILIDLGRYIAAYKLFFLLDIYKIVLKGFFTLTQAIHRKIKGGS